jgi:hypothetical protein
VAETHYLIEVRDCTWSIVTIMAGDRAIGEFMIFRSVLGVASRRNRFAHVWGVKPPQ